MLLREKGVVGSDVERKLGSILQPNSTVVCRSVAILDRLPNSLRGKIRQCQVACPGETPAFGAPSSRQRHTCDKPLSSKSCTLSNLLFITTLTIFLPPEPVSTSDRIANPRETPTEVFRPVRSGEGKPAEMMSGAGAKW